MYTKNGEKVSIATMKIWADAMNMSVEEYVAAEGYTLINETEEETETQPTTNEPGKINGVETPGTKTTETAGNTELSLDDTSSGLPEFKFKPKKDSEKLADLKSQLDQLNSLQGGSVRGKQRKRELLKQQIKAEQDKLFKVSATPNLDDAYSLVNQEWETVANLLESKYPIQVKQTGFAGRDIIEVINPKTGEPVEIDFENGSYEAKMEAVKKIEQIKFAFDTLDAEKYTAALEDTFIKNEIPGSKDIEQYNYGLKGTGYEIKESTQNYYEGDYSSSNITTYNIYKDNALVENVKPKELKSFLDKTLTSEDYKAVKNNTYKAYETLNKQAEKARLGLRDDKEVDLNIELDFVKSGSFSNALSSTLVEQGTLTKEEGEELKNYIDSREEPSREQKRTFAANPMGGGGLYNMDLGSATTPDVIAYKKNLEGLPENLKNKISEELVAEIYKKAKDKYKELELPKKFQTISEGIIKDSGMQDVLELAGKWKVLDEKDFVARKKEGLEIAVKTRDNADKIFKSQIETLAEANPGAKFKVEEIEGQYLFSVETPKGKRTAEEQELDKKTISQFYILQNQYNVSQINFKEDIARYFEDVEQYQKNKNNLTLSPQQLVDLSIKEYGTGAILQKDFIDAAYGLALTIPTLLGNTESSLEEQKKMQARDATFETMLTYDEAASQGRKGLFALRTGAQQAPNILLAIATSGTGSAVNLSKIGTQLAIGTTFGASSGAQKYRDLLLQKELGKEAIEQKKMNLTAYETGAISYSDYKANEFDLNKTIAYGDLTDSQITSAAWATAFIEGGISSVLGTAPNSLKVIKDFSKAGGVNITSFATKNAWQRLGVTGLELGKRQIGELAEEELIYFGDTAISEGLILGRDMDFSQWDDTAVSTIITAGSMNTPGIAYSGLMANAATNKFNKDVAGHVRELKDLSLSISALKDGSQKDILISRMADVYKSIGTSVAGLEVDAIGLGVENQENLFKLSILEQSVLSEAGVKRSDSKEVVEQKVKAHKEKLVSEGKSDQAEDFDTRRATLLNQVNQIKEDVDYSRVDESLGDTGARIDQRLSNKNNKSKKAENYRSLDRKGKLAFVIAEIRNDQRLENIKLAKESPATKAEIEKAEYKDGKPLTQKAKNEIYAKAGESLFQKKSRAIVVSKTNKAAESISNVKDLKVVAAGSKEAAMEILEGEDLTQFQKDEIWKALNAKNSNGYIYNNRYIAINPDQANAAVEKGDILAGTAMVHEVAHAIDDRVFNSEPKRKQYAVNLQEYLSTSEIPGLKKLDRDVRKELLKRADIEKENAGADFENTTKTYKDEYTKVVQELLYANDYELNLEVNRKKEGIFRGVSASTPERAFNYLLNRNADAREGKVSRRVRRKIGKGAVVLEGEEGKSSLAIEEAERKMNEAENADPNNPDYFANLEAAEDAYYAAVVGKETASTPSAPKKEKASKPEEESSSSFSGKDKQDIFSGANKAFNDTAEAYGVNLRLNEKGEPLFTEKEWDAVPLNTKLGIGVMVGEKFKPYVEYLMGSRRDVFGFDEYGSQIIDRTSTGIEKGDDGIPFLLKTYNPSKGTKMTTHVFGQINNRLQGVIDKTEGFGESTVDSAPSETNKGQLVSTESADSNIKTEERGKAEGKAKQFPKITDEVIVLDNDGGFTTISEQVAAEVKNSVKVVYATSNFKNEVGTKAYRTELVNALRNKLGNLFKSIMDRGVDYNNDKKVGNKDKRANYDAFVDSNFQSVYSIMPKSTISDRFPFLMEPVLNPDGTPYEMSAAEVDAYNDSIDRGEIRGKRIANKYAGNKVYVKRPYNAAVKKEGTDYLKANDKKTNVRNARKTSFADVIAEEAALDILPEVLRDNNLEKEAVIVEIEKQIGRGKFSLKGLNPTQIDLFTGGLDTFMDSLITTTRTLNKRTILSIFKGVYNPKDYTPGLINGIVKQFADQLSPLTKKGSTVEKTDELVEAMVGNIVNQTDQNKNFVDLVIDEAAKNEKKNEGKPKAMGKVFTKGDRIAARGLVVDFYDKLAEEVGVDEAIKQAVVFGNSTFNSSGVSGKAEVYDSVTNSYVKVDRSRFAYDLFTKNEDYLKEVLQKIDPTVASFKGSIVTRKDGSTLDVGNRVKNYVTDDMIAGLNEGTWDSTEQHDVAERAKEYTIKSFKYAATIVDPYTRAIFLSNFNDGSNNALRAAAKIKWSAIDLDNLKKGDYRYEHMMAARVMLGLAYDHYVKGDNTIDIDAAWNDYVVAIVPKAGMDTEVNNAGFAYTMYAGYVPGESSIFDRYYNIFTMGRVKYPLKSVDGKTTIGQNYADFYKENQGKTVINKTIIPATIEYKEKVKEKEAANKGKSSEKLDVEFNTIIERDTGVESYKVFSKMVARRRGASVGKFKVWMPSTLDDFKGLTSYTFSGKGRQGDADKKFFKDNLIDPYFAGIRAIETAKQTLSTDLKGLNKMFKSTVKNLRKLTPDGDYTYDQAVRVYLWTKSGYEIEGLSKRDAKKLNELVAADENLSAYADGLQLVSKRDKWNKPSEYWDSETLLSDLNNMTEKGGRKAYLETFIDNANVIFSEKNLNKIEALYGTKHAEALRDILYRMENGTNRPSGNNANVNKFNNWLNNSIGAIMFFNRRSALLQTLSTANFINWSDNNPAKAALAFANQPQFWKDFAMIFNSDMLKQRRSGLKTDVNEAEIANAAKGAKNKASAVLSYLLKIGFTPTQMVDSFAIASGGASFYRNRLKSYLKKVDADGEKLYTQEQAEKKAFEDFSQISEETQQSGDPALISSDQASVLGRLVLAFQNTPIQLNRSIKKSAQDLYNRRRTPGQTQFQSDVGNLSKIVYYGAIQNLIFSSLQTALFAMIPGFQEDDDELTEEEQQAKYGEVISTKQSRIINGMIDTTLKGGFGLPGAVISTLKNVAQEYIKQDKKGFTADHAYTLLQAVNLSPPVGSKLRKGYSAIQTKKFDKDVITKRGFDITINGKFNLSPAYSVVGNVLEGTLNIPTARLVDEVNSITEALDARNTAMQRLALALGWKTWDVGAKNEEHELIKSTAKVTRKKEGIEKAKKTRLDNKIEYENLLRKVTKTFNKEDWKKWRKLSNKVEAKKFMLKVAKEKGIK